jgi:hypothetical protein
MSPQAADEVLAASARLMVDRVAVCRQRGVELVRPDAVGPLRFALVLCAPVDDDDHVEQRGTAAGFVEHVGNLDRGEARTWM